MGRAVALLLLACCWAQSARAQTSSAPEGERLTILFTSDQRGASIARRCDAADEGPALLARTSAALREERARAARDGEPPPLLLDAGDALFPSPMVGDLTTVPSNARAIVSALRSAGYDAMATGNTTLGAPRLAMVGFMAAARQGGLPLLATNLRCAEPDGGSEPGGEHGRETTAGESDRCAGSAAALRRRIAYIQRGSLRIGVFSVLPADLAESLARANVEGLELTDPVESAAETVAELRAGGADLVVLLSHVDHREDAPRRTLELIRSLDAEARPDLVIAAGTASLAREIRTGRGGPAVVAVRGDGIGRVQLERRAGRWAVIESGEVDAEGLEDELLSRVLASYRAAWCERQERRVRGGTLSGEMDEADFLQLAIRVMREQTRADIALLNQTVIGDRQLFPLEGPLTEGDLRRALPFENGLRVATIRGSKLDAVARRLLDAQGVALVGLERQGKSYRINGRPLDPDARYRFVTIDFLAEGGDGILDPAELEMEAAAPDARGNVTLVDRVRDWLGLRSGDGPYDPEERVDLFRRPLWAGVARVNFSIADLQIADPTADLGEDGYDQPQLDRQELFDIRLEASLRGGVSTRDHRWDNQLTLRFGFQRLQDEEDADRYEWSDSVDLIQVRSTYVLDVVRNRLLDGAWYGPSFFLEYDLESEFWPDEDTDHFLEMSGAGGLQFRPTSWLRVDLGGLVRARVPTDVGAAGGVLVRAELTRRRLFSIWSAPLFLSALVDYVALFPFEGPTHKLTTEVRLEMQVWGPLMITGSARLFLYDESWAPVALAFDSTFGLGVNLSARSQRF